MTGRGGAARSWSRAALALLLLMSGMALLLHAMGRVLLCPCGVVRLWAGSVHAADNSQQLADWYSFTHVVHGLLLYAALALVAPRVALPWRLVTAVAIECGWEVVENSPAIIARYRQATIAIGYTGDSILNSLSDVAMMALGFGLAAWLPPRRALALAVGLELAMLLVIRDNLTLNILMLVRPVDAIRAWQAGA